MEISFFSLLRTVFSGFHWALTLPFRVTSSGIQIFISHKDPVTLIWFDFKFICSKLVLA